MQSWHYAAVINGTRCSDAEDLGEIIGFFCLYKEVYPSRVAGTVPVRSTLSTTGDMQAAFGCAIKTCMFCCLSFGKVWLVWQVSHEVKPFQGLPDIACFYALALACGSNTVVDNCAGAGAVQHVAATELVSMELVQWSMSLLLSCIWWSLYVFSILMRKVWSSFNVIAWDGLTALWGTSFACNLSLVGLFIRICATRSWVTFELGCCFSGVM